MKFVSLLAEPLHSAYRQLCLDLSAHGFPVEFAEFDSWNQAQKALKHGQAPVGAMCGLLYTVLRSQGVALYPLASPTLSSPRHQGQPHYWSDIVVRADSPLRELSQLTTASWLYNERASFSGYRILASQLSHSGPQQQTGSHRASLDLLLRGHGDFTTLDSTFVDFLPQETRAALKTIQSLGPYPAPLLVAHRSGLEFLQECQKLSSLPAPLVRLQPVRDSDYQPIQPVWNQSLQAGEQLFLSHDQGPEFTHETVARQDREILDRVASLLRSQPTTTPQAIHTTQRNRLQSHHYLVRPQRLTGRPLTVVGFLSQLKPGADMSALFAADDSLVEQFHLYDGFLSYSPTEYAPGRWANLAIFEDLAARDTWSANSDHLRAIRELGPSSYKNIRLHLGTWPDFQQPIEWLATRYLNYDEGDHLWRGVRLKPYS